MPFLEGTDASAHQENVYYHYVGLSFESFANELWHIITLNPLPDTDDDVYIHVISYLTGSLLYAPWLFFTIVGFVFGYFYISALSKILVWDRRKRLPLVAIAFIFLFIIYRGVDNLQTVRTWTGMWVLFDGILGYFQTGKRKYLLLMLMAPLIHFAYFAIALPAYFIVLIKKNPKLILIIIYSISFVANIASGGIIDQINKTELGQKKVEGYYHEDPEYYEEKQAEVNANWYVTLGKVKSLWWGSNALAFSLILGGFYTRRMTRIESSIFSVGLLTAAFANFGDFIPAFYSRTMVNAGLYILAAALLLSLRGEINKGKGIKSNIFRLAIWISILVFIPKVVYTIANMLYFTSVFMIVFPAAGWLISEKISIRELVSLFL